MGLGVFSGVNMPKLKIPALENFGVDTKGDLITGFKDAFKGAKKQFDFTPVKDVAAKNAKGVSFSGIADKFKETVKASGVPDIIANSFPDQNFGDIKQGVQLMKSLKPDYSVENKDPQSIIDESRLLIKDPPDVSVSVDQIMSNPEKYAGGTVNANTNDLNSGYSVFKLYPDANEEIKQQADIFGPKKDMFTGYLYDSLVTTTVSNDSNDFAATSEVNNILDGFASSGVEGSGEAKEMKTKIQNLSYDQKKAVNEMDRDKLVKKLGIKDWESYFYSSENTGKYTPEQMQNEFQTSGEITNFDIASNPADYVTYHGRVIKKSYLNKGMWWVLDMFQHPFDHVADLMGEERLAKFGAFSDSLTEANQKMRTMSVGRDGFNMDALHKFDVEIGGEGKFLEQQKEMATSDYISNDAKQIFKRESGSNVDPSKKGGILEILSGNKDAVITMDMSSFDNIMGDMTGMFNQGRGDEVTVGSMGLDYSGINYRDMLETRSDPSYLKNVAYESKVEENIRNGFIFNRYDDHKSNWEVRLDTINKGVDNPFNVDKEIDKNSGIIERIIKQIL